MRRRNFTALALGLLMVTLLALPYPPLRRSFAETYSGFINRWVWKGAHFGQGGRAQLIALTQANKPDVRGVTQDAQLEIRVDGMSERAMLGVNLRRDVYLPLVLFSSAVVAAPIGWRRRGICLGFGLPMLVVLVTAALEGMVIWFLTFQTGSSGVYPREGWHAWCTDALFTGVLVPPSHRFFVPLILAAIAVRISRPQPRSPV